LKELLKSSPNSEGFKGLWGYYLSADGRCSWIK
jgi:hypothetical protein